MKLSCLDVDSQDYTTLSKRGSKLGLVSLDTADFDKEFSYICMDSTGIQTYTGNEWLENKHGKRYIRRTWEKVHIIINNEGQILANATTEHTADDRSQIEPLIANIKAKEFLGDPGYDDEKVYQLLADKRAMTESFVWKEMLRKM